MKASDMTIDTVAGRLNVHRSTVKRLFSQYRRTGIVTDAELPGRPRVTTNRVFMVSAREEGQGPAASP